jgi:hypothetical protein
MRIAYLAAGAAGMYCGSCLHDNTLAAALRKLGEDVVLVPIYTPIRTDEQDVSERVFFGGINAYLQRRFRSSATRRGGLGYSTTPAAARGGPGCVDPASSAP